MGLSEDEYAMYLSMVDESPRAGTVKASVAHSGPAAPRAHDAVSDEDFERMLRSGALQSLGSHSALSNEMSDEAFEKLLLGGNFAAVSRPPSNEEPGVIDLTAPVFVESVMEIEDDAVLPCRFCYDEVRCSTGSTTAVCRKEECCEANANVCSYTWPCGHPCCGVRGEQHTSILSSIAGAGVAAAVKPSLSHCLYCQSDETGIKHSEGCPICTCELASGPVLRLDACGHAFHKACIEGMLQSKWSKYIAFTCLACPMCRMDMQHWSLASLTTPLYALRETVREMGQKRVKLEGLDKKPDLMAKYGTDLVAMAEDKLTYYQCKKCNKPYFGGLRECEAAGGEGAEDSVDATKLVCPSCMERPPGSYSCTRHSADQTLYKCKWCCAVAEYFCAGMNRYCERCHGMAVEHRKKHGSQIDWFKVLRTDATRGCVGPDKCPLKVKHPPHGHEFVLGCSQCKAEAEAHRDLKC
jgi:E3 ubiquitin-protein ligase MYCBP2